MVGDFSLFSFYFTLSSKFSRWKKNDFCNWKYIGLAQKFMHVFPLHGKTRMNFWDNLVSITFSWEGEVRAALTVSHRIPWTPSARPGPAVASPCRAEHPQPPGTEEQEGGREVSA